MAKNLYKTRRWFLRTTVAGMGQTGLLAWGSGANGLAKQTNPSTVSRPTFAASAPATPGIGERVVNAGPGDYLVKLAMLRPGDTLLLSPGNYGVDAEGNDTAEPPGLPIFNLHGTQAAPIVITGPSNGSRPRLVGRSTHNTIRLSNASHVTVRGLEVDGRNLGGSGVATHGPSHHIVIEDNYFHGIGANQQTTAISTAGHPTWGWVLRGNLIVEAGTGIYLGNSNGDGPFVGGLIENNVIRDTIGYCMQVKHQLVWSNLPLGMPTGKTTTVIRHNVFSKSSNSSEGDLARPNLLLGDQPPSGPGSANQFSVYGNLFYENPSEALFQAEGNFALYNNVLVTTRSAVNSQRHNGLVRNVRIFCNTIVAGADGVSVSGGATGYTQRIAANAIFAGNTAMRVSGAGASAADNITDMRSNAPRYLNSPLGPIGALDLFPNGSRMQGPPIDQSGFAAYPDWNRDFNGNARDSTFRGAYSGSGSNPGWTLALDKKP